MKIQVDTYDSLRQIKIWFTGTVDEWDELVRRVKELETDG